ncbi:MAG: RNA polymerase sigma factor [Clostridia bacterium]|nr:RNA polymerase sigma factor [Clostridia bacterium]
MDNGASSYRRFLSGDENAFEEIVKEYRQGLTWFINRFVCDTYIAEDIAADVFAYVLVHPKKYDFRVSLKTYLYMLGRSRALDALRKQKRQSTVALDEKIESADDIEKSVLLSEEKRALSIALNSLDENLKSAVHLVFFEGLSYKEAGRVMKKTEKQIDNLLYRAKKELRSILEKGGITL